MKIKITITILALLMALVTLLLWAPAQGAPAAWVETWSSTSAWTPVGGPCWTVSGSHLHMDCQSAGLVSNQTWSKDLPLTISAVVSSSASSGEDYFAGLVIYDAQSGDTQYGEIALARRVPPFNNFSQQDSLGGMVNEVLVFRNDISPGSPHTLSVKWTPGRFEFYLDTVQQWWTTSILLHDLSIFLVCASVGEGTPDDGSAAACDFGPVTVTGTFSADARHAYLPSVQEAYP